MRVYHRSTCRNRSIIHVISRLFRRWIVSSRFFLELEAEILEFIGSHEIPRLATGRSQHSTRKNHLIYPEVPVKNEERLTYPCDNPSNPWQVSDNPRYSHLPAI